MSVFASAREKTPPAPRLPQSRAVGGSVSPARRGPLHPAAELRAQHPAAPATRERGRSDPRHRRFGHARSRHRAHTGADRLPNRRARWQTAASKGASPAGTRSDSAIAERPRGPKAGSAPAPTMAPAAPRLGCRALTAKEGAEDETFLLVPLEETPEGPEHRSCPARPPLASPRRRKGRWQLLRPRCLAARPPGNTARDLLVPAWRLLRTRR